MTKEATVLKILPGGTAEISVSRDGACGKSCVSCGAGCAGRLPNVTARAENAAGAHPGDRVLVESGSGYILKIAAFSYLIPIVLLFVGYFSLSHRSENMGILGAITGLFIGFGLLYFKNRAMVKRTDMSFKIVRILR